MRKVIGLFVLALLFSSFDARAALFKKSTIVGAAIAGGALYIAAGGIKGMVAKHCRNPNGSYKAGCYNPDLPRDAQPAGSGGAVDRNVDAAEIDEGLDPDDSPLLRSAHTAELRKGLNAEQISAGLPPDPDDCDAHHIVPKTEGRKWAVQFANDAREVLESCNIDIDSPENGIYLPGKKEGAKCGGSYHKTLHKKKYYESIAARLIKARTRDCNDVADELRAIKNDLAAGRY